LPELDHPNVVRILDVFNNQFNVNLVMELMQTDLEHVVKGPNYFPIAVLIPPCLARNRTKSLRSLAKAKSVSVFLRIKYTDKSIILKPGDIKSYMSMLLKAVEHW
jgi:serine/threonine protein kinase